MCSASTSEAAWPGVIGAYGALLGLAPGAPAVTLHEGGTPLVPSRAIGPRIGRSLWLKVEGANPTGSFKDRGMTIALTRAVEQGRRGVICASTGNTAASAAAYAARAGLRCFVVVPAGGIAAAKVAQALVHGAVLVPVEGTFDAALRLARGAAERLDLALVNSLNPDRLLGQQSVAWEICDALGGPPDLIALPVGNAGNITALWRGLRVRRDVGAIASLPRLLGVQAAGAAPLVEGRTVAEPRTVASAIRVGDPASRAAAVEAVRESGGRFLAVGDDEILEAQALLARDEGVFVEPASAAGVAGLLRLASAGALPGGERVVAILTGHGLKDPQTVLERLRVPDPIPATLESVASAIDGAP